MEILLYAFFLKRVIQSLPDFPVVMQFPTKLDDDSVVTELCRTDELSALREGLLYCLFALSF